MGRRVEIRELETVSWLDDAFMTEENLRDEVGEDVEHAGCVG